MSTARLVPETTDLDAGDARAIIRQIGTGPLVRRAVQRLRVADGMSHARSLAFCVILTLVPALIAAVGIAEQLDEGPWRDAIIGSIEGVAPAPADGVLAAVEQQGQRAAGSWTPVVLGLLAALVAGSTALGQVERSANRIYGIEQDRPTARKYGLALLLTLTIGLAGAIALVLLGLGRDLGPLAGDGWRATAVDTLRWPVGLVLIVGAIAVLFKIAPHRHQPGWAWLALGAGTAIGLWVLVTLLLGWYARAQGFSQTYGSLAGLMAVLLWAYGTGISLLVGLAITAQLEAERAHVVQPQDQRKVVLSSVGQALRQDLPA